MYLADQVSRSAPQSRKSGIRLRLKCQRQAGCLRCALQQPSQSSPAPALPATTSAPVRRHFPCAGILGFGCTALSCRIASARAGWETLDPTAWLSRQGVTWRRGSFFLLADVRLCPLLPLEHRILPTAGLQPVPAQIHQSCDSACRYRSLAARVFCLSSCLARAHASLCAEPGAAAAVAVKRLWPPVGRPRRLGRSSLAAVIDLFFSNSTQIQDVFLLHTTRLKNSKHNKLILLY